MGELHREVDVRSDLTYGTALDHQGQQVSLKLDVYQRRFAGGARRPAVIWVHGGGFYTGDKNAPFDQAIATYLALTGFTVFSVNYRLRPDAVNFGPGFLPAATDAQIDVQTAVAWTQQRAGMFRIDPSRVGVAGLSAGAITSIHAGFRGHDASPFPLRAVASLSGAAWLPLQSSPASPPALLINGSSDDLVPIGRARSSCMSIQTSGGHCTLVELPTNHFLTGFELHAVATMTTFLAEELDLFDPALTALLNIPLPLEAPM